MSTVEERLAEIRDRIVAHRTQEARQDAALRLVTQTGAAPADAIEAALADWAPPSGATLDDLVTRKAQAAVSYHEREVEAARVAVEGASAKVGEFEALLDKARYDAEQAVADDPVGAAETALSEARETYQAAVAAGGDAGRAPSGRNIAVTPQSGGTGSN